MHNTVIQKERRKWRDSGLKGISQAGSLQSSPPPPLPFLRTIGSSMQAVTVP